MATIYRRGKQWWGRVQREGKDRREPLETTSEAVARKRLKEWLERLDLAAWGGKPRKTFDDAMVRFIQEYLPTKRPKTRTRYLCSIDALTPSFEGLFLDEIRSAKLGDFETTRRRQGARIPEKLKGKMKPRPVSGPTIRRDLACLSSMFGCAMEWEWVEFNPVPAFLKSRKKRGLREAPAHTRYLTLDEERRLLAAARGWKLCPDLYDALCVAIDTGMRLNEQFSLVRGQVSQERNQIELTEGTKNSKPRDIPLLPRTAQILAQKPVHMRSEFVFTNRETGTRYTNLGKALLGAAKRAQIRRLTWHDLRRTCGCRLLQDYGMSIEKVSKWLGHSSIEVTQRSYAFLETEHLHEAVAAGTKPGTGTTDLTKKSHENK